MGKNIREVDCGRRFTLTHHTTGHKGHYILLFGVHEDQSCGCDSVLLNHQRRRPPFRNQMEFRR